jgi:CheY-like chemotaxis protein
MFGRCNAPSNHHRAPDLDRGTVVLVVDDNPAQRATAVDMLEALGCRVFDSYNGRDALRLLDLHAEIAVLLADVRMPGMTGEDLAQAARRIRPDLRIVLTSGFVEEVRLDGVVFLPKPYRAEDIGQILDRISA